MSLFRMLKIRKITILSLILAFSLVTLAIISRNAITFDPDREVKL